MNPERVQVWFAEPARIAAGDDGFGVLPAEERARAERLRRAEDRHAARVTRLLVRSVLSHQVPLEPGDWRFRRVARGRPVVANPGLESLRFSVSHVAGLVVCAVAWGGELGVDVETPARRLEDDLLARLARRTLSPAEAARVLAAPAGRERRRRFLEHWSLREAYAKALGLGLALDFAALHFARAGDGEPTEERASPENWRFALPEGLPAPHLLALARRGPGGCGLRIEIRSWLASARPATADL